MSFLYVMSKRNAVVSPPTGAKLLARAENGLNGLLGVIWSRGGCPFEAKWTPAALQKKT